MAFRQENSHVNIHTLSQAIHALQSIQERCNILKEYFFPLFYELIKQNPHEILDINLLNELKNNIPPKEVPYTFIELFTFIWNSVNSQNQISQQNNLIFIYSDQYKSLHTLLADSGVNDIFFIVCKRLCKTDWKIQERLYKCIFFKYKNKQKITCKLRDSEKTFVYGFDESNEDYYVCGYMSYEAWSREQSQEPLVLGISNKDNEFNEVKKQDPSILIKEHYPLIYDRRKSGIPNFGNTCYLNSFLQVLASNNEFCQKIQTLAYPLFFSLSSLLSSIKNAEPQYKMQNLVEEFKNQLGLDFPRFRSFDQQDTKELMMILFEKLSELTDIDSLFTIKKKLVIKCLSCEQKTEKQENNYFILIPSGSSSIEDVLANLKKPKEFFGDNQLICEECKTTRDTIIETEEIIWSSTVTFYLPISNDGFIIKDELKIDGNSYRWYGLICHYGRNTSFGHYMAYTWDTHNWTEYNDFRTKIVDYHCIDKANGYLAFYARSKKLDENNLKGHMESEIFVNF